MADKESNLCNKNINVNNEKKERNIEVLSFISAESQFLKSKTSSKISPSINIARLAQKSFTKTLESFDFKSVQNSLVPLSSSQSSNFVSPALLLGFVILFIKIKMIGVLILKNTKCLT